MISVGIDVSKGKSTVCVLKSYGEIVLSPKDYRHTTTELDVLASKLATYDEEIHVIMEVHIPQELRIRSRGTERHSASNCAKLNRLISYHRLLCDPCQEIQDDMPWMSFGLSRHLRRWNPQKADTIRILESVR